MNKRLITIVWLCFIVAIGITAVSLELTTKNEAESKIATTKANIDQRINTPIKNIQITSITEEICKIGIEGYEDCFVCASTNINTEQFCIDTNGLKKDEILTKVKERAIVEVALERNRASEEYVKT